MANPFTRTELIYGSEAMKKLKNSRVAVFGIGGVGGYVVEALARTGVGTLDLIDDDIVNYSNLNRQIYALHSTLGKAKVDVAEERCKDINPEIVINKHKVFYLPETKDQFDFSKFDYVVDCIDTVSGKIQLIVQAKEACVPVISSMGAGNKTDPSKFKVADIYETTTDPLARVMRHVLRKRNIPDLKVVFSTEEPKQLYKPESDTEESEDHPNRPENEGSFRKQTPGSNAFVPSSAGLLIASEIIRDLVG
ncbi:MAG: tRNA threonylcarbamoyladenosine dehydratase [Oscillospiraceae bacterium]|nr:tRNA threonylcarbamoyladenosine dehydratase [Oscillospiraceae bacterium]MBR0452239.1 tRNA threonylcarbamoyladenosine dehydratase [Oscillospiraceae bacterium]